MTRAKTELEERSLIVRRLGAQLLSVPARSVERVAEQLLAIQAQELRSARLAIRARSIGLTSQAIDEAFARRSVVVSWLNRGTLHLVPAEDFAWLHALTTPQLLTGNLRRLAQEGVTPAAAERGVKVVLRALAHGPQTRAQLRERLDSTGVRVEGQALVHLLFLATLRGLILRGPMHGAEHAFVLVRDWLELPDRPIDLDDALGRLARRFLAGHGPATDRDLARWAGITSSAARRGLAAIESELETHEGGVLTLRGTRNARALPPPKLLGAFDPVLHGWVSRRPILGPHEQRVVSGGHFRAFALVDGRAVATWHFVRGKVELVPFTPLGRADAEAVRADADDLKRFLGRTVDAE